MRTQKSCIIRCTLLLFHSIILLLAITCALLFSIYALIFSNIICGCLSMRLYFKACIHIELDIAITKFRFYFVMILVSISTIFVICIFDVWTFGWFLIQLNDEYAVGV